MVVGGDLRILRKGTTEINSEDGQMLLECGYGLVEMMIGKTEAVLRFFRGLLLSFYKWLLEYTSLSALLDFFLARLVFAHGLILVGEGCRVSSSLCQARKLGVGKWSMEANDAD